MAIIKTWNDLRNDIGQTAGDFSATVAEEIGTKICELHQKYPNSWVLSPFGRGFLTNICPSINVPPPNRINPQFEGGQCIGEEYFFTFTPIAINTSTCQTIFGNPVTIEVVAPISQVFWEYTGVTVPSDCRGVEETVYRGNYYINTGTGKVPILQNVTVSRLGIIQPVGDFFSDIKDISIAIKNGQDNCGNSEDIYPPDPPIDPQDFNIEINIDNYNINNEIKGSDTYIINIPQPPDLTFPIDVEFGGDQIEVNYEGFDAPEVTDTPPNNGNQPNNLPPNSNSPIVYEPPSIGDYTVTVVDGVQQIEEEITEANQIVWILIDIEELPKGDKQIIFSDTSDNTYFAGYISWTINVNGQRYRQPEIPIRKQRNAFQIPQNVTGYRVYSVNFAKLKITKYNQIVENSSSN